MISSTLLTEPGPAAAAPQPGWAAAATARLTDHVQGDWSLVHHPNEVRGCGIRVGDAVRVILEGREVAIVSRCAHPQLLDDLFNRGTNRDRVWGH